MSNDKSIVPETAYEQVVQHEQKAYESSNYWQKVSEFYGKVYDGMDYTAYIASGNDPYVVMVKLSDFAKRYKFVFFIITFLGLTTYLTRIAYLLTR